MLDNSQIATYQTCPMKYFYKYVKGYEKDSSFDDVDLVFGKYFHKYLEAKLKGNPVKPEVLWSDYPIYPEEKKKTQAAGIFLCKQYDKRYPKEEFEILDVEYGIEFLLGVNTFIVKVDTVVSFQDNIFGLEHKTTGGLYRNYFDRYFINSQVSAQCYAIAKKYGHCEGIIINACEIGLVTKETLFPIDSPEIENYEKAETRYSKYYGEPKVYCSGYRSNFERSIVNRTKAEIDDWQQNAKMWGGRIVCNTMTGDWLRSDASGACSSYGRGCTYREICKAQGDQQIIDQLYHVKDDPLDYLELRKEENDTE